MYLHFIVGPTPESCGITGIKRPIPHRSVTAGFGLCDGSSGEAGDASVSGSAPGSLPEVSSCGQGAESPGDEAGNSAGDTTDTILDETSSDRGVTTQPSQSIAYRRSQRAVGRGADAAAQAAQGPAQRNLAEVDGVAGDPLVDEVARGAQTGVDRDGRPNARRRVSYSVGFKLPDRTPQIYSKIPESAWAPAYNADGDPSQGADVAEITGMLDLTGWPEGMRVIMRRERPHPGARLRFDDVGGYRLTALATNTRTGQLPGLEVRHRLRARCEDRIRCAKDTGLDRFPLQGLAANRIWCQIVALAHDLLAWSQLLALTGHRARRWEPRTIRLRLMHIPATIARHARRVVLRYRADHPWTHLLLQGIGRLQTLPAP